MKPAICILAALLLPRSATAQPSIAAAMGLYHSPAQIPAGVHDQYVALGNRVQKPGNERITLTGTLTDSFGASVVQVVIELGGKLSVTWVGKPGQKVIFNGANSLVGGNIAASADLLEAFVDDLPETMMWSIASGTGVRVLGQRFPDASGGLCDYFDVPTLGKAAKKQTAATKRYCFDSKTRLLRSVRYMGAPAQGQTTVTQFGNWMGVNGQAVAGNVVRLQNGIQVFQFQAQTAAVSPGVADSTFAP
jgi:hypothetical protein